MGDIPPTANRMKEARVKRLCIVIILLEKIKSEQRRRKGMRMEKSLRMEEIYKSREKKLCVCVPPSDFVSEKYKSYIAKYLRYLSVVYLRMLPGLLISTLSAVCAIIEHGLQTVLAGAEPVITAGPDRRRGLQEHIW